MHDDTASRSSCVAVLWAHKINGAEVCDITAPRAKYTIRRKFMLQERSKAFSLHILQACNKLKNDGIQYILAKQLARSATSIGANIHEANYAASKSDFVNKLQIALKECYESEYWLDLISSAGYLDAQEVSALIKECGSIRSILIKSINTTKNK